MPAIPKLRIRTDQNLVDPTGETPNYLLVEIDSEQDSKAEAQSLNLCLVVDQSGSLNKRQRRASQELVLGIARQLNSNDRLTLITFAEEAETQLSQEPVTKELIARLQELLANDRSSSGTNLSQAWLQGVQEIVDGIHDANQAYHHVIVLSDGKADQGILEPKVLRERAQNVVERGVITSAIGIGDGFQRALLKELAQAGGGRLYDENQEELAATVVQELRLLPQTCCIDLNFVLLWHPTLAGVRPLSSPVTLRTRSREPEEPEELETTDRFVFGTMEYWFQLGSRWRMPFPIELLFRENPVGKEIPLKAYCLWRDALTGEERTTEPVEVLFRVASDEEKKQHPRDRELAIEIAESWRLYTYMKSADLRWEEKDFDGAVSFIQEQLTTFRPYCDDLPSDLIEGLLRAEGWCWSSCQDNHRKSVAKRALALARKELGYIGRDSLEIEDFL